MIFSLALIITCLEIWRTRFKHNTWIWIWCFTLYSCFFPIPKIWTSPATFSNILKSVLCDSQMRSCLVHHSWMQTKVFYCKKALEWGLYRKLWPASSLECDTYSTKQRSRSRPCVMCAVCVGTCTTATHKYQRQAAYMNACRNMLSALQEYQEAKEAEDGFWHQQTSRHYEDNLKVKMLLVGSQTKETWPDFVVKHANVYFGCPVYSLSSSWWCKHSSSGSDLPALTSHDQHPESWPGWVPRSGEAHEALL